MTWREFLARLGIAAALTPVIRLVDHLIGGPDGGIAWAVAALAALCLVFIGEWLWLALLRDDV